MTSSPLVTVIALCYNHSHFVIECLKSIYSQSYENIQLIIMDDCSSDDSVTIINDWIQSNNVQCLFVSHRVNKGICATLNEALSHARGKYISMVSTDDVWLPDKLRRQVDRMEQLTEEFGVLYSNAYQIDELGNLLPNMFIDSYIDSSSVPEGGIFDALLEKNFIPAMTTLIRKSCYDRVGLYDEKLSYEDWDMWLRISQHYKFAYSGYASAKYRIVKTSLMHSLNTNRMPLLISDFHIVSKVLASSTLSDEQVKKLHSFLIWVARWLYQNKHKESAYFLWQAARRKKNFRNVVMCIAAFFGVSYSRIRKLDLAVSRLENYFAWKSRQRARDS